jgi:hypothetical protein
MPNDSNPPQGKSDLLPEFCRTIANLDNAAMTQIAEHLATMPTAYRARFVERCTAMAGSAAETMANEPS